MKDKIYFVILTLDDGSIIYFQTLSAALERLASEKNGVVTYFYLRENGTIIENDSEWWSWNGVVLLSINTGIY